MVLLVEPVIEADDLRVEFLLQRVNGVVQRVEMAAVSGLVVFVTCQNQLLELAKDVDLAFQLLFSV